MAWATYEDIEKRLGYDLDESERTIADTRLNDVENIILERIPDLEDRITDGKINPDILVMIECESVIRLLRNPQGIVGETDGNYSYQLNWSTVSGRLELMPEEWRMLGYVKKFTTIRPVLGSTKLDPDIDYDPLWGPGAPYYPPNLVPWIGA